MNSTQRSRLTLLFVIGQNEFGENVTRTRTLNNVKGTALDEDVAEVATKLAELQQYPLADVARHNSYSLM